MNSTYYSPKTLSRLYHVPLTTIWKMIRGGSFYGVMKIGKHYRVSHEARVKFEKENQIKF